MLSNNMKNAKEKKKKEILTSLLIMAFDLREYEDH